MLEGVPSLTCARYLYTATVPWFRSIRFATRSKDLRRDRHSRLPTGSAHFRHTPIRRGGAASTSLFDMRANVAENDNTHDMFYAFVYVSDLEEGLGVVNVKRFVGRNPANNSCGRLCLNPDGILSGATFVTLRDTAYTGQRRAGIRGDVSDR